MISNKIASRMLRILGDGFFSRGRDLSKESSSFPAMSQSSIEKALTGDIIDNIGSAFHYAADCLENQSKEFPELESEYILRELIWLRHGCGAVGLYGDDGEMHCNLCGIDFKRDPAHKIKARLLELGLESLESEGSDGS